MLHRNLKPTFAFNSLSPSDLYFETKNQVVMKMLMILQAVAWFLIKKYIAMVQKLPDTSTVTPVIIYPSQSMLNPMLL
jgi:hypothetical protein